MTNPGIPMTSYRVSVSDLGERRNEITRKAESANDRRPFYQLYSGNEVLPVIQLDIKTPLYRVENYRTQTRQLAYVRDHNLASDYFVTGLEDVEVQQVQHEILVELAQRGSGESIIPIVKALSQDNRQTEPLVITREGIVLNGNRRLAAMRELHASEPGRYSGFTTIDTMVLPADVTQDELRRVEFKLQMRPQTQLPYDWANRALAVRDLRNREMPLREIAALMRLEKEADVLALVEELQEAEIFLQDYLGSDGEYERVEAHQQLFGDLQQALRTKKTTWEKEASRSIAHVMAKHSRTFGSRIYDYKAAFGAKSDQLLRRLAERYSLGVQSAEPSDGGDVFDGDTGNPYAEVTTLLRRDDISDAVAENIKEIVDELKEESKEQNVGQRPLKNAQKALALLTEIDLTAGDERTYKTVRGVLEDIRVRCVSLQENLEMRRAKAARRRKR